MKNILFFSAAGLALMLSCTPHRDSKTENASSMEINDPHTYAEPGEAVITHLDWEATVDFKNKIIEAKAAYLVDASADAEKIMFDSKGLQIEAAFVDGEPVEFRLEKAGNAHMGERLTLPLHGSSKEVTIHYRTGNDAEALQWLDPAQTAGRLHPFLFTQSQAILARSWLPVQDSPGIRFTYQARLQVPAGLMALMSAENPAAKSADGRYDFKMDQPIPAYLMALAVGDLTYHSFGEKTGVYAEPAMIEAAAHEFGELENMLGTAEKLYGDYRWGKYDLLVLPPSFPFGGMENPRLTFVTPTILAGDRSLTSLVAHELAHSWSGNLVTNATWNDFWLNEGFTVYFERRIMEEMYGQSYAEMLAQLGFQDLQESVADLQRDGHGADTKLKLDLQERNPDDGVTDVAYEKGYSFLRLIEEKVGRDRFDAFLVQYFNENAFKSMTTEAFIKYLNQNLFEKYEIPLDERLYQEWIYSPGIPENAPSVNSKRFEQVDEALALWMTGRDATTLDTREWSSHEWLRFIRGLPEQMTQERMAQLDEAFNFTNTGNSEMLAAWLRHAIRNEYENGYESLERFLIRTGRRKFLVALYGELIKTEKGKEMARQIYRKARGNYHFVSVNTLDQMLDWKENQLGPAEK